MNNFPFFRIFADAAVDLIYPPLCIHCHSMRAHDEHLFCTNCLTQMEIIDPHLRCRYCFKEENVSQNQVCINCRTQSSPFHKIAGVFDYHGPPSTLIKKLKYANAPYLAEGIAALMAVQFHHLNWPMPDIITDVPCSWIREIDRGFNQSRLIAEHLSQLLKRPFSNLLKRNLDGYSQAGLSYQQRQDLPKDRYQLRSNGDITDQTILLVDDVMTTGATLNCCAEALQTGYPHQLYALVFCKA